jgi:hypothetical protein
MNTLTNNEALELGRIFRKNGTGIDVVRKLALQYPHLSGHQLTSVATAWDQLQAKPATPAVTETAAPAEVDPDKMQRAVAFAASVNAAEAKPLGSANTGDLYALTAAYFA